jgi:enoyl-CoA hydratase/3-hydroxyacyl-CoA dehydrogenase
MKVEGIKTPPVIGAGDMGHGMAEVALIAGYKVHLTDISEDLVDRVVVRGGPKSRRGGFLWRS